MHYKYLPYNITNNKFIRNYLYIIIFCMSYKITILFDYTSLTFTKQ